MSKAKHGSLLGLAVCLLGSGAFAQMTTEQFIPIGQSPGISGKSSYVGTITAVDEAGRTVSIVHGGETHTLTVSAQSHVWLDRSGAKKSSIVGRFSDCRVGRRVEILPSSGDETVVAWIKVEAAALE